MKTDAEPLGPGRVFRGLPVSPGIAIGPAHIVDHAAVSVPEYRLPPDQRADELARFHEAAVKARRQIRKLKTKALVLPGSASEEVGFLLDAHLAMVTNSRLTRGVEARIREHGINAEAAIQAELDTIAQTFAGMGDAYLAARMTDVREVGRRLIRNLMRHEYKAFSMLEPGTVILAEELTPADTALLDPRKVAGFATVLGGAEGHTAIMARSLGLPAVLGAAGLLAGEVRNGLTVIVDGVQGRVHIDPTPELLEEYRHRQAEREREREQLKCLRSLPPVTRDGTAIAIQANLELPRDLEQALDQAAEGIGLLRTEFLFMNRDDLPDEDEQYDILRPIVEGMGGRLVTARTMDVGGEKLAGWMVGRYGEPTNPALGLRAIRLGLREPRLLETQLAAMLRAGAHGPLRILLPMITSVTEVQTVREMMLAVARRLRRRGVRIADPLPPLGVMIEVPGAALSADALTRAVDFFSIGTNDLTQYTLAIDRGDEQVASLYDPLHPAVLRLIQFAVEAALRAGIPVGVCGEMAGDPRYTALLLGLGVRELSMAPPSIPVVKRRIRTLDLVEATRRARVIMDQHDGGRIAALLDDFNAMA
ncbi:phosphoenolpyruvate--protein phosphotransferase [Azospirillum sp. RWY-5-1]|uniref:Phosphoenolpyruvate-protein phosphotransferase n=1 Tax=Azospirillum oleiclasticum TaxID=2735135 RepID=A0ABX2TN17_9PROT|nr:phosphoenolpyruvate--protein phosphotransferase [Azospirillum oleiclasticum]NYZ17865.1 phosphoenolpyruvate--protein phosphotransferase [Azospirillum oleiclasticum]NYZ25073.1 phosphoenolpyruvate--protein phosphotransferase [Azospirillum oleiclasticum]